jgi:hypothetical protein
LDVSSGAGTPGENVAIEISVVSPAEPGVSTLKWETTFPAQLLQIDGLPEAGPAATKAGKSLTCRKAQTYSYVCILAGGSESLGAGTVAVFHFKIHPEARPGTSIIRTAHVEAVSAKLDAVPLLPTEGQIEIK